MKKTWQKALTLLLAVCLCVGLGASALAATGTGSGLSITLSAPDDPAEHGDTVTVNVMINNNPGLASIRLKVHYDPSVLTTAEANAVINTAAFPGTSSASVNDTTGMVGFTWIDINNNNNYSGVFATITFTVKDEAKVNSALFIEYDQDDFYDVVEDEVTVTYADDQTNSSAAIAIKHTLSAVAESASTCAQAGTEAYWKCTECGAMFSDAAGTKPITAPVALPLAAHTLTEHKEVPSTCKEQGTAAYWTCSVCNKMFSDAAGTQVITAEQKLPYAAHTLTETKEVPSTCKEQGTAAYWTCSVCNKMFSDAAGTKPITAEQKLPYAAHTLTETKEVPSTCKDEGTAAFWTCSVCNKLFSDAQGKNEIQEPVKLPLAAHTLTEYPEEPATCQKEGTAAYWKCSVCQKMFSDAAGTKSITEKQILPVGPHTLTETKEVPSTCKEHGTAAFWTCSVCKKLFSDAQGKTEITEPAKLPLGAHTLTKVAEVPAQCEKEGTAAYWKCSVCGKLFSDAQGKTEIEKPASIPATDHDWDDGVVTKPATCTEKGIMTYTCKNDPSHIKEEDIDIDPEAHDWTAWTVTKEPTDTEDGERQRSCKNHPDVIETEVIPHDVLFVITFDANGGTCTVESAKTNKNGMLETLPTATRDDFRFVGWFTAKTGGTMITTDFIFKADTTVYAQWQAARRSSGGFVDPRKWPDTPNFNKPSDPTQPTQPTQATVPTEPTQPAAPAQPTLPFGDVEQTRWSYEDILFVYENGLMNGTSGSIFAPAADVTRGMIVTILYRLEGSPAVTDACPFADVKADSYYEKPITWAAANGIVNGYSADRFGPDDPITREQLAAILYRYAQTKGEGFTGAWYFPLDFADAASVSEWADEAMHWCVMNGLINGSNGSLNPDGTASREQTAAILHRFCENILK